MATAGRYWRHCAKHLRNLSQKFSKSTKSTTGGAAVRPTAKTASRLSCALLVTCPVGVVPVRGRAHSVCVVCVQVQGSAPVKNVAELTPNISCSTSSFCGDTWPPEANHHTVRRVPQEVVVLYQVEFVRCKVRCDDHWHSPQPLVAGALPPRSASKLYSVVVTRTSSE